MREPTTGTAGIVLADGMHAAIVPPDDEVPHDSVVISGGPRRDTAAVRCDPGPPRPAQPSRGPLRGGSACRWEPRGTAVARRWHGGAPAAGAAPGRTRHPGPTGSRRR